MNYGHVNIDIYVMQCGCIYRQKDVEEEKVFVAAAMMGNMDTPPDDNHTWRKYGQKEILGFKFPR